MKSKISLTITSDLHELVERHLFPGDGLEAAAILICSSTSGPRIRLLANEAILIPYDECLNRSTDSITWPGRYVEMAIDKAETSGHTIILIHSHPGGLFDFSDEDDRSDCSVLPSIFQAFGDIHGSAIMVPGGAIRGRTYSSKMICQSIEFVSLPGNDIRFWWEDGLTTTANRPVAFTSGMTNELKRLSVGIVGVSGTGSLVAEQVARLGFGSITLIDFDQIEPKNLNRIINSTVEDASNRRLKVDVFADAILSFSNDACVCAIPKSLMSRGGVLAASQCDVIFCCVDTLEARYIADLISAAFLIPLFDVGVVIPARNNHGQVSIIDVCGRIDYVFPGGSTLRDRGVYDSLSLETEYLRNADHLAYKERVDAGYMRGTNEEAPAVIALNMRAAAACVMEFIARAYPYRLDPNKLYARTEFSLAACEEEFFAENRFTKAPNLILAQGKREPLLGLPALRALAEEQ